MTEVLTIAAARQLLARFGDAAWLMIDHDQPTDPVNAPGAALYLCDVNSGRTLVLETRQAALQTLCDQTDMDEVLHRQIHDALSMLLEDLLDSPQGIHPDTRRGVILAAALCITSTRGFHITKHHGANLQHLLLRYPDAEKGGHVLTPMPLFKAHPIPAAELNAAATHVLMSEQLNFPGRFAKGRPTGFAEKRRNVLAGKC